MDTRAPKTKWLTTECHVSDEPNFERTAETLVENARKSRFDVLGLTPGVRYYAQLVRIDPDGNEAVSEVRSAVAGDIPEPTPDLTPPAKPTGLLAIPVLRGFLLVWDRHQPPPPLDRYELQYDTRPAQSGTWEGNWRTASDEVRNAFFMHVGLDYTLEYRYRVRVVSRAGLASDWSDPVAAGEPGKASLAEDVVGKLAGDYLDDGIIDPRHLGDVIRNERDEWNQTVAKINFQDEITGTIASVSDTTLTTSGSPFDDRDLSTLVVRVTRVVDGVTYYVLRGIRSNTANTLTIDKEWPTGPFRPNPGDTFSVGTAALEVGTAFDQTSSTISLTAAEASEAAAYIAALNVTPQEISSAVSEVFPEGTGSQSAIQQLADQVAIRVQAIDQETGNPVQAQIYVTVQQGQSFILLDASRVIAPGTIEADQLAARAIRSEHIDAGAIEAEHLAAKSIKAEHYEDLRNNLVYSKTDSLDADHPMEMAIYIPSETTNIVAAYLVAQALPFRAYSKGTSGGGGIYTTTTETGDHYHTLSIYQAPGTTSMQFADLNVNVEPHSHSIEISGTAQGGAHTHNISVSGTTAPDGGHSHAVSYSGDTEDAGQHWHSDVEVTGYTTDGGEHGHEVSVDGDTGETLGHSHSVSAYGSTTSGGSHSHSISASGSTGMSGEHSHAISIFPSTDPVSDHTHAVSLTGTASGGAHNHELDLEAEIEETTVQVSVWDRGHAHNFTYYIVGNPTETVGAHHHDIEIPDHDHGIIFGIYEDTTPANVTLEVNNGSGYGTPIPLAPAQSTRYDLIAGANVPKHNNSPSEMDLKQYLSGTGWKWLRFKSSRLGRIEAHVVLKVDLTA